MDYHNSDTKLCNFATKHLLAVKSFIIILFLQFLFLHSYGQYEGGSGGGYAMAEIKKTVEIVPGNLVKLNKEIYEPSENIVLHFSDQIDQQINLEVYQINGKLTNRTTFNPSLNSNFTLNQTGMFLLVFRAQEQYQTVKILVL